mmetsp:Transcript_52056/g.161485  ORF Transcript_52056/g.161485 Transcript_52056/m.161485 type:complete len:213 (+) Transcript_52056:850-1488(+)
MHQENLGRQALQVQAPRLLPQATAGRRGTINLGLQGHRHVVETLKAKTLEAGVRVAVQHPPAHGAVARLALPPGHRGLLPDLDVKKAQAPRAGAQVAQEHELPLLGLQGRRTVPARGAPGREDAAVRHAPPVQELVPLRVQVRDLLVEPHLVLGVGDVLADPSVLLSPVPLGVRAVGRPYVGQPEEPRGAAGPAERLWGGEDLRRDLDQPAL